MNWTQVSLLVDGEAAEAVAEALRPFAHGGVSLEQTADDLNPEAILPQLAEQITVSIYFPSQQDSPARRRRIEEVLWHLGQLYPIPAPTFSPVREEDWAEKWKEHYRPLRIGQRILICPAWESPAGQPGDLVLLMDPGMAFGTGLHPTTRMCLEAIEESVKPGMSVLDIGTGSGILAIAAAGLKASPILAVDNDPVAVQVARQNCSANGVADVVQVVPGSLTELPAGQTWDIVLVNILAPVILDLLGAGLTRHVRPGGLLVLAGIIEDQVGPILAALEQDHQLIERRQIGDWVTLVGQRRAQP